MRCAAALSLLALALAGCGSSAVTKTVTAPPAEAPYPARIGAAFLRSCETFDGNSTACTCALHQAEARIPLTEIGRDELELEYGTPSEQLQSTLGRIIGHCAGQQAIEELHRKGEDLGTEAG